MLMVVTLLMIIVIISFVYYFDEEIVLTDSLRDYFVANDGDGNFLFENDGPF